MITFHLVDGNGKTGSITVPSPKNWYYRLVLRFAAWLWNMVIEAENASSR